MTEVRIVPSDDERVAAYASITIDDSFVVHGLRVKISKKGDLFLFMPGRRRANGTYVDIVLPINNGTRRMIDEKVFAAYQVIAGERVKRRVLKELSAGARTCA
jgi:stage V sporulation protein G